MRKDLIAAGLGVESLVDGTIIDCAPVVPEPVISEPAEGEVQIALLESDKATSDVQRTEEVLEDLTGAATALEGLYDMMSESLRGGGMYPQTAQAANMALSATLRTVGIQNPGTMSMESFGMTANRKDSTVASMEAIDGWVDKIWQAIKSMLERVKEAFGTFFDTEDKKLAVLEKWAGSVIASTKDQKQREGKFVAGASLSYNNSHTVTSMIDGFKKASNSFNPGLDRGIGDVVESSLSAIIKTLGGVTADIADLNKAEEAAKVKEMLNSFKEAIGETKLEGFIGVKGITLNFDGYTVDKEDDKKEDLDLLSGAQTKGLAEAVQAVVKDLRTATGLLRKGVAEWEKTISGLQAQVKKAPDTSSAPSNLLSIVTWNKSISMYRFAIGSVTNSSFAALKYCAASQGKGEAKA